MYLKSTKKALSFFPFFCPKKIQKYSIIKRFRSRYSLQVGANVKSVELFNVRQIPNDLQLALVTMNIKNKMQEFYFIFRGGRVNY